jgi:hypothetical protein
MSSSTLASSTTSTHHSLAATQNGVEKDLSSPFPPFAHQEVLATPFEAEIKRDEEFQARMTPSARLTLAMLIICVYFMARTATNAP